MSLLKLNKYFLSLIIAGKHNNSIWLPLNAASGWMGNSGLQIFSVLPQQQLKHPLAPHFRPNCHC